MYLLLISIISPFKNYKESEYIINDYILNIEIVTLIIGSLLITFGIISKFKITRNKLYFLKIIMPNNTRIAEIFGNNTLFIGIFLLISCLLNCSLHIFNPKLYRIIQIIIVIIGVININISIRQQSRIKSNKDYK